VAPAQRTPLRHWLVLKQRGRVTSAAANANANAACSWAFGARPRDFLTPRLNPRRDEVDELIKIQRRVDRGSTTARRIGLDVEVANNTASHRVLVFEAIKAFKIARYVKRDCSGVDLVDLTGNGGREPAR